MAASLADLLNPTGAVQEEHKSSEIYKVTYKDSKTGVYKSVIRFIPNPVDPSKSIVKKYVSWVKNPTTKMGMFVDCPSRESGLPSPVSELYFRLYNTQIQSYQDYAKEHLSSKLQYASLVQIVHDEQHPEYDGQIKVFTFGKKIYDKLQNEQFPVAGDGTNPFHPFYGRRFSLVCTSQSGFNNFDQSCFFDEKKGNQIVPSGLWYLNPATNNMEVAVDGCDIQAVSDYLLANSPDLSKYESQPWTDAQRQHVDETIAIITNFLNTGSIGTGDQVAHQSALSVLNSLKHDPNPVFPGAMYQPAAAAQKSPVATNVSTTPTANVAPVFPGSNQPNVSHATPVFPGGTPTASPTSTPTAAPVTPQFPNGTVTGVEVPNVAPKVAPQTTQKRAGGVNVDDILMNL